MEKTLYQFDDSMFPARDLIEEAVNEAGYELNKNYTGSSKDPALAAIFTQLVSDKNLEVLEVQQVEITHSPTYPMEKALIERYSMTKQQSRTFERLVRMAAVQTSHASINKYSFADLNYIAALVLLHDANARKSTWFSWDVTVIYAALQQEWKAQYKLDTLAPFSFVQNYFRIDEKVKLLGFDKQYSNSNIVNHNIDNGLVAAVKVAFMFSPETVENLVKNGLTAESIMKYIDAGIGSSKEILEWSENMPAEWASALLGVS